MCAQKESIVWLLINMYFASSCYVNQRQFVVFHFHIYFDESIQHQFKELQGQWGGIL